MIEVFLGAAPVIPVKTPSWFFLGIVQDSMGRSTSRSVVKNIRQESCVHLSFIKSTEYEQYV